MEQRQFPGTLSRHPDDSLTLSLSLPLPLALTVTAGTRLALISPSLQLPANILFSFETSVATK